MVSSYGLNQFSKEMKPNEAMGGNRQMNRQTRIFDRQPSGQAGLFVILGICSGLRVATHSELNSTQSWIGLIFLCKNHKPVPHFFSAPTQTNSTKFNIQPYFNQTGRFMLQIGSK